MADRIVILHLGAGVHSDDRRSLYKELAQRCGDTLTDGKSVMDTLRAVSRLAEDCEYTNTGYGSSLTVEGDVESDSSVLVWAAGQHRQAAVACGKSRHPIARACELLAAQEDRDRFGLTRPVFVVDTAPHDPALVSGHARRKFEHYKEMMAAAAAAPAAAAPPVLPPQGVTDTIGVVVQDTASHEAVSACSSGGNMFKPPGRIGCAAVVGASHYQLVDAAQGLQITLMSSGNGEDIIGMDLCRHCCQYMQARVAEWGNSYSELLREAIAAAAAETSLQAVDGSLNRICYVGVVGLLQIHGRHVVVACHSTESFVFCYHAHGRSRFVFSKREAAEYQQYEHFIRRTAQVAGVGDGDGDGDGDGNGNGNGTVLPSQDVLGDETYDACAGDRWALGI